ncbi:hypothetical protein [Planococcus glaciei]|uniref:hypothetical protein n=1 Tax=Planococcus glaciei TaxID=459472 RepID=UPI001C72DF43|nr:hypothetical protein [Planococcus glaciei]MBX0313482.1 hypothetical protein [Planococcus glaciei]
MRKSTGFLFTAVILISSFAAIPSVTHDNEVAVKARIPEPWSVGTDVAVKARIPEPWSVKENFKA